jgi:hypothetical protein
MAPRRDRCGAIDTSEVLQCGSTKLLDETAIRS